MDNQEWDRLHKLLSNQKAKDDFWLTIVCGLILALGLLGIFN